MHVHAHCRYFLLLRTWLFRQVLYIIIVIVIVRTVEVARFLRGNEEIKSEIRNSAVGQSREQRIRCSGSRRRTFDAETVLSYSNKLNLHLLSVSQAINCSLRIPRAPEGRRTPALSNYAQYRVFLVPPKMCTTVVRFRVWRRIYNFHSARLVYTSELFRAEIILTLNRSPSHCEQPSFPGPHERVRVGGGTWGYTQRRITKTERSI